MCARSIAFSTDGILFRTRSEVTLTGVDRDKQ